MGFFQKLLGNTFSKLLMKKLENDEELQELLKEGDKLIDEMTKSVITTMLEGRPVPSYVRKYIPTNPSEKEKNYITIKVIEQVYKGVCPTDEIVKLSNFDDNHPMWSKYLVLKEENSLEEGKISKRIERRKRDEKRQEEKEVQRLISKYGKVSYDKSVKGEIFNDMNVELLLISKGEPQKKEVNLVKGKKSEVWYYGEYINRLNNKSYKLSIRLVEDVVVGWKNL